ncbi:MAG: Uncharacterized protein AUREO_034170 [Aureobasidium pullulans]|nr:MAG: Uncharacterized protein AUREO_034170 [Aureobasidium pullulans]
MDSSIPTTTAQGAAPESSSLSHSHPAHEEEGQVIDSQHDASLAYLDKFDKIIHKLNSMEVSINNTNNKLNSMEVSINNTNNKLNSMEVRINNTNNKLGKLSAMVAKLIDDQK